MFNPIYALDFVMKRKKAKKIKWTDIFKIVLFLNFEISS